MQFIYNVDDVNDCIENSKSDCVFETLISEIKIKTKVLNLVKQKKKKDKCRKLLENEIENLWIVFCN